MANRPLRKEIKYTAIYWLVKSMMNFSNAIPRRWWITISGGLGRIAWLFSTKSRKQAFTHLSMAYPEKSPKEIRRMVWEMFIMIGKNGGDVMRATSVRNLDDFYKFVEVTGDEHAQAVMKKGKGLIFLPSHLGAFELMVTYVSLRGYNPMVIGTPLKDERLNELMVNYRNAHGAIPVERGKETMRLIKGLLKGGSTAVLIDQDTKVKSRFVNFYGMPAATPIGAAVLALKTGAGVVPAHIYLGEDGKQHMHLLPEIPLVKTGDEEHDLIANTQNYTASIEKAIREHPTQWVWFHERWKTKPGEEIL